MACYECNFFYYDECEGCETCHYEQEQQEVELWLTEMAYDEPDHLAWLEELDMKESEVQ